jgi:UDP-N-acetylglucosamine acyltransferase
VIHHTAIVHSTARLDPTVRVGPYAIIDQDVIVGPGCEIGPHVYLTGQTVIGVQNRFHAGCVVGEAPQDLKYQGQPTRLVIGDRNVFREHVTVHRSTTPDGATVIGCDNFLMVNSHVGHNSALGNRVILANGASLGGHVVVEDRAFISANCLVHQFTRVGSLSLMQGSAGISKDLPPYTIARGINEICGLNSIGLRRAGISSEDRLLLRRIYHAVFRSGKPLSRALAEAKHEFSGPLAEAWFRFIASSRKGVCQDSSLRGAALEPDDLTAES